MDLSYVNRLAIAFIWTVCVVRNSLADEELEAVKSWMPRPYQDRKIMRMVEQQLLKLFGFKKKANPRKTLHVPDHIWTMYRKWNGEAYDDTDKLTNIVRVLHHDETASRNDQESMLFNVRNLPTSEIIRKAELHLFKRGKSTNDTSVKAGLYAHWQKISSPRIRRSLVKEKHINMTSSQWETFDVTRIVQEWLKVPLKASKFVLKIDGKLSTERNSVIIDKTWEQISTEEWERKRPFLVIESRETSMKRERRSVRNSINNCRDCGGGRGSRRGGRYGSKHRARKLHEKAKIEVCRRRSFYLNFQSINWSKQIISPMGFDMYYCQGKCPKPLGPHMNTTNHAVIQNQVNSFDPLLVPPPCCVPSTLGDQSFLYIDPNSQIVMKTYTDIVVEGCGCR